MVPIFEDKCPPRGRIKGHQVSFNQNGFLKLFHPAIPVDPKYRVQAEVTEEVFMELAFRKKKKRKQNTELIRLVYLFRSKRVFAFVAFIPILPAQGALEDELPRNTKF